MLNRLAQARGAFPTASVILFYFMSVLAVELAEMDEDGQAEQDGQVGEVSGDGRLARLEASVTELGTAILALTKLVEAGQRSAVEPTAQGQRPEGEPPVRSAGALLSGWACELSLRGWSCGNVKDLLGGFRVMVCVLS